MSISGVGLSQIAGSSNWRTAVRQANQDFDQLYQSLQNGNLGAAQQAYNNFQQIQGAQAGTTATPATATPTPVAQDWSVLGQALQSGDLSSAKSALGKLQQDAQAAWQSHRQQEAQTAQSVYELMQGIQGGETPSGTTAANSSSATGNIEDDLTALNQALQTGDSAGAQKLLAQLEQDLQASGQSSAQRYGGHHHHGGPFGMNAASAYGRPAASVVTSPSAGSAGTTSGGGISAVA